MQRVKHRPVYAGIIVFSLSLFSLSHSLTLSHILSPSRGVYHWQNATRRISLRALKEGRGKGKLALDGERADGWRIEYIYMCYDLNRAPECILVGTGYWSRIADCPKLAQLIPRMSRGRDKSWAGIEVGQFT